MSYVFRTQLPLKLGDKLYSFYNSLNEYTVESIKIYAVIKEVIEKSSGDIKIDESLEWHFGTRERREADRHPNELGKDIFLNKLDLKTSLLDENFLRVDYPNKCEYSIPVTFELGQKISYAYEGTISDTHFNKIVIRAYYNKGQEPRIDIKYYIPSINLEFSDKDFETNFHFNREVLVNKLLGL